MSEQNKNKSEGETDSPDKELWPSNNRLSEIWSRDQQGLFFPMQVGGCVVSLNNEHLTDRLALLNAHRCSNGSQECQQNFLPGHFNYCPDCRSELDAPYNQTSLNWLAPGCFNSLILNPALTGLNATTDEVLVTTNSGSEHRADEHLSIPQSAEYRFLVGNFGYGAPRLLAIDIHNHFFFYLDPDSRNWQRMTDEDGFIGESCLPANAWACSVVDPEASSLLYVVSEAGLLEIRLDLLNRQLRSRIIATGKALAAPALHNNQLLVPMEMNSERQLYTYNLGSSYESGTYIDLPKGTTSDYQLQIQDERKIIWSGSSNQLILRFTGDNLDCTVIPWPVGIEPQFEFGAPARYQNQYWQLCFDQQQDAYCYLRMGGNTHGTGPDTRATPNPRLSTGLTHFLDYENYQTGEPWFISEKDNDSGEMLLPVTEFGANLLEVRSKTPSILCIRLQSSDSLKELLNTNNRLACEVVMLGEPEQTLERLSVSRPWESQCFIYSGCLWLYNRELKNISGWRLARHA